MAGPVRAGSAARGAADVRLMREFIRRKVMPGVLHLVMGLDGVAIPVDQVAEVVRVPELRGRPVPVLGGPRLGGVGEAFVDHATQK